VTVLTGFLAIIFPWAESFNEAFVSISQDLNELAQWLWSENGIYVQMVALIIVTALVGAIALLKIDKAEQLGVVIGASGGETCSTEDEGTVADDAQTIDESTEVDA